MGTRSPSICVSLVDTQILPRIRNRSFELICPYFPKSSNLTNSYYGPYTLVRYPCFTEEGSIIFIPIYASQVDVVFAIRTMKDIRKAGFHRKIGAFGLYEQEVAKGNFDSLDIFS